MLLLKLATVLLTVVLLSAGCRTDVVPAGAVNVVEAGADPTGMLDSTEALTRAHAAGKPVFYPNGTYRFNGRGLDLSGVVHFESSDGVVVRNDISADPVLQFDNAGNLVGLQQNHLEEDWSGKGEPLRITSGSLVSPPISRAPTDHRVTLLAHWYNDFGLESKRHARGGKGWLGWYYWSWNFHRAKGDGYDPERHPLLGFYRGDDPVVLDWQCYWLREHAVSGVLVCHNTGSMATLEGWERPEHLSHWVWQLFHNVPNFRGLRYVMYAPTPWAKNTPENKQKLEAAWLDMIDVIYARHSNAYVIEQDGKRYPVLYLWAEAALRGVFDNYRGSSELLAFYTRIAARFRELGWDGVALFARQQASPKLLDRAELARHGIVHMQAFYAALHGKRETYPDYVSAYSPPVGADVITSVVTAHHTHTPHPSKWQCPGHSPKLFEELLVKAVAHIEQHRMPRIVTCYNVAEWAEGGPGLQPNMKNRFGYLEAVRNVLGRE